MIRILHLSDPHFGAADLEVARVFTDQAPGLRPDLTILSGDLTMRARRRELADAKAFVAKLPAPLVLIPGNHDIPSINQPVDRFFRPFKRYRETFRLDLEPELESAGFHVISLNSSRPFGFEPDWSNGRLSRRQIGAIGEKFSSTAPAKLRIVVTHHPLLELKLPGRQVVRPLPGLMEALETARVDLVLCGHFHRSQIAAEGLTGTWKTLISQAPTVCSTRLQGEPQGFHEILLGSERAEILHHVYEEGRFHPQASFAFEKTDQGWIHAMP